MATATLDKPEVEEVNVEKVKKVLYRKEGSPKLTESPDDYKTTIHQPLKESDFEHPKFFWRMKVEAAEANVVLLKEKYSLAEKLGNAASVSAAKKLMKIRSTFSALVEQLKSDGMTDAEIEALGEI